MSDDDSNDVVMVENVDETPESEDTETRPIMQLFHRLINNETKQNTVLTNAQIISILHKEFDLDFTNLHELEVDIYLNIVKRFLKDWPKWDEFDQGINSLRKINAYKSLKKALEEKYKTLKEYLQIQLVTAKPLVKEVVEKLIEEHSQKMESVDTSEITLEINCTRKQLNNFVLSQPISCNSEVTVFNVTEFQPTSITVNKLPIEAILNWFSIRISIDIKCLYFTRSSTHRLRHVLVNTRNGMKHVKQKLNTEIKMKDAKKKYEVVGTENIFQILDSYLQSSAFNSNNVTVFQAVIEVIRNDLQNMPTIKVPGTYKKFSNEFQYYRKLKNEIISNAPNPKYDLYIEETLAPVHGFYIGKLGNPCTDFDNTCWFSIECLECSLKFYGDELYSKLREHFDLYHSDESDWSCTNCDRSFTMTELACKNWVHDCN